MSYYEKYKKKYLTLLGGSKKQKFSNILKEEKLIMEDQENYIYEDDFKIEKISEFIDKLDIKGFEKNVIDNKLSFNDDKYVVQLLILILNNYKFYVMINDKIM